MSTQPQAHLPRLALYGDSIGRGVCFDQDRNRYVYLKEGFDKLLMQQNLAELANFSRFGALASEGLDDFLQNSDAAFHAVAIQYGGNDCTPDWQAVSKDPDRYHPAKVPLADFEDILTRFVHAVRERKQIPVLVTPPPLVSQRYVDWIARDLDKEAILRYLGDAHHVYRWQEQYGLSVHKVARHTQCKLFDLRAFFLLDRRLDSLYCVDGMHPNQKGHETIAAAVGQMLPQLFVE